MEHIYYVRTYPTDLNEPIACEDLQAAIFHVSRDMSFFGDQLTYHFTDDDGREINSFDIGFRRLDY